jgi:hypothetical protein
VAPAIFKTGTFKYIGSNDGVIIDRTNTAQVETDGTSKISFSITWLGNGDYLLYSDATNPPAIKNNGYLRARIVAWSGNKYYCQYITESKIGGTCAFEKIK